MYILRPLNRWTVSILRIIRGETAMTMRYSYIGHLEVDAAAFDLNGSSAAFKRVKWSVPAFSLDFPAFQQRTSFATKPIMNKLMASELR